MTTYLDTDDLSPPQASTKLGATGLDVAGGSTYRGANRRTWRISSPTLLCETGVVIEAVSQLLS